MKLSKKISNELGEHLRENITWAREEHEDYASAYMLKRNGKQYRLQFLCGTTPRLCIESTK